MELIIAFAAGFIIVTAWILRDLMRAIAEYIFLCFLAGGGLLALYYIIKRPLLGITCAACLALLFWARKARQDHYKRLIASTPAMPESNDSHHLPATLEEHAQRIIALIKTSDRYQLKTALEEMHRFETYTHNYYSDLTPREKHTAKRFEQDVKNYLHFRVR